MPKVAELLAQAAPVAVVGPVVRPWSPTIGVVVHGVDVPVGVVPEGDMRLVRRQERRGVGLAPIEREPRAGHLHPGLHIAKERQALRGDLRQKKRQMWHTAPFEQPLYLLQDSAAALPAQRPQDQAHHASSPGRLDGGLPDAMHLPVRKALTRECERSRVVAKEAVAHMGILDHRALQVEAAVAHENDSVNISNQRGRATQCLPQAQRLDLRHGRAALAGAKLVLEQLSGLGDPRLKLNAAHHGKLLLRGEVVAHRLHEVLDIHLDLDVDIQCGHRSLVCGHDARVAVVDEEVHSQGPGREVVDAAGPEGHVAQDGGGLHGRCEAPDDVCELCGPVLEPLRHLQAHVSRTTTSDAPDSAVHLKVMRCGEIKCDGGIQLRILEDVGRNPRSASGGRAEAGRAGDGGCRPRRCGTAACALRFCAPDSVRLRRLRT
mmetsp:Transcript_91795/g.273916  ORF Transcript_91795/g.273916 Transcript_91795/m.273916 type:complete len:433 (+) Transcript_91795:66-1364(+)